MGPQDNTEQPVLLGFNIDKKGTAPTGPVGPQSDTEQPVLLGVNTDKGGNGPNGPVGHDVMLAGRGEMVDRPDLVGPHSSTEQSVFLRLDVDQVEHVPANIVLPGVKMFRNQPVADGPAGPDRTRRHAVKEVVRRSRLTIMALNEYDAPPFEQRTDDGTPGCSDSEDTSSQCMSTDDDSDDDFFQYNDWHNGMNTVMPGQTADDTNRTVRNGNNNCAQYSAPENGNDTKSDVNLGPVGRAKSKFTTTEAGIEIDSLGVDYAKCDEIPVIKMIPVGVLDTDEHLVMRVSTITAEVSGLETSLYSNDAMNDSPGFSGMCVSRA